MKHTLISLIVTVFALCCTSAHAENLTIEQMQALKSYAQSDQIANGYLLSGNDNELSQWFNAWTSVVVWRATLTPEVMRDAIVGGAVQLDNLTVGKRDALLYLVDGELPNTATLRTTLDDLCGNQNTLKASIQNAQKRTATRAEAALSTGTGTTQSPATLGWEGAVSIQDVVDIRSQ